MDNICHTLVGAACGEAGLKRTTRFGNGVLMIAANLPDADVLAFLTDVPAVALRRGWTHGVLAQAVLPILLTGAVIALDRVRPPRHDSVPLNPLAVLLVGYVGVLSHVGLDWLNNYGVRLLMPFSNEWFRADAVFIADPWLWLTLGAGIYLARRRARSRPARAALIIASLYIAVMVASAVAARRIVMQSWIAAHGTAPQGLMVGPVFADPLRKTVIADAGDRYERGTFRWSTRMLEYDARPLPRLDSMPAVTRARTDATFRHILTWARFPYYELEPAAGGTRVTISDVRFGRRLGTASVVVED